MSHSGSDFYKPFIFVLGALVLLTFFLIFAANTLSPDGEEDPLAIAETKKSIAPVGQSRVVEVAESAQNVETAPAQTDVAVSTEATDEDAEAPVAQSAASAEAAPAATETATAAVATAATAATTATDVSGSLKVKAAVATNCAGCHNDGLDGAAKTDDAAAWSALADQGVDQLTAAVISGKGKMPARAESNLSDDEIRQAVELMIANATGSAASSTAATATQTDTAAEVAPAATATEIPAEVKQAVDSACTACHLAGVAGAPKFGDQIAWAPRLEKGIDALVASSISGIGVMPARGGTTLNNEQMRLAVEYMLTK